MKHATSKQTGFLWAITLKYGNGEKINWIEQSKKGNLSISDASHMIGLYNNALKFGQNGDKPGAVRTLDKLEQYINKFNDKFRFNVWPWNDEKAPKAKDKETETETETKEPETKKSAKETGTDILDKLSDFLAPKVLSDITAHIDELIKQAEGAKSEGPQVPELPCTGDDYIKPEIFDTVGAVLKCKCNVLLYGPAGCGKSLLSKKMAETFDTDFTCISFSGGVRYSQVFGSTQMRVDENGKQYTEFIPGELLKAVQKPGLVLIDEIFGADPDVNIGLNGLIEPSTRSIMTPAGEIKVHDDCFIIAAANTNGRSISSQYTGAQRADDSLNDRFAALHMDYSKKVEDKLFNAISDKKIRKECKQALKSLRKKCRRNNINYDPSTRRLVTMLKIMHGMVDYKQAFDIAFLNHLSTAERSKIGELFMEAE